MKQVTIENVKKRILELERAGYQGLSISLNEERELDCLRQLVAVTELCAASISNERTWETTMMQACGEDGPKSVAEKFAELKSQLHAVVAENAALKEGYRYQIGSLDGDWFNATKADYELIKKEGLDVRDKGHFYDCPAKTPATSAAIAALRAESRKEGAIFAANRMLAAWDAGFVKDTPENAADIARAILVTIEFMDDAPAGDFDRSFADEMLKDIDAQIRIQPASPAPLSAAITDIIAERQRQQSIEGWTPEHDDTHDKAEMVFAAISYLMAVVNPNASHGWWPWDAAWWKPTNPRRDLVKAGALIAAEIERIDRQSVQVKGVQS